LTRQGGMAILWIRRFITWNPRLKDLSSYFYYLTLINLRIHMNPCKWSTFSVGAILKIRKSLSKQCK
jgi:hypothetical protein